MSIDWFTFAAQIVNFLILVALLRWLLYKPVVRAMTQREEKIASQLQEAAQKRQEGEEKAQECHMRLQEIEERREAMLYDARREADEHRKRLTTEARDEVRRKRQQWQDVFDRDRMELLSELQRGAGRAALQAARQALSQLADEDLERQMFSAFQARLEELDDVVREEVQSLLKNGKREVFVRSAFEVSAAWRDRLANAVRETFGYEGDIDFEQSPDLICGIEVEAGGHSFGWNANEFLRIVENDFDTRLKDLAASK